MIADHNSPLQAKIMFTLKTPVPLATPLVNRILLLSLLQLVCALNLGIAQVAGQAPESISGAVTGQPFGVFVAELPIPPELALRNGSTNELPRILVHDAQNRVSYPVLGIRSEVVVPFPNRKDRPKIGRPGGLIDRVRNAVRNNAEPKMEAVSIVVSGLFRGEGPLRITLSGELNQEIEIVPNARTNRTQLLARWWDDYVASAQSAISGKDFPTLVHKYLVATLARRLGFAPVDLDPPAEDEEEKVNQPLETLALLAAIEPLREQVLEDLLIRPKSNPTANQPLPAAPSFSDPPLPQLLRQPEIESLATRVPPECFYLRFGAFANFIWFQDIAERYGGDVAQAVLLRGFNYEATAKMERMLAAKMTTLAKLFGGTVVGDMALVGTDLYMKEGASLGVIFHAKNPGLLSRAIESDRQRVAEKNPDATVSKITLAGKEVLLLSTPDNRIRSFFVSDGEYICVTTSQTIVRRFLEVGSGEPSLADTAHFQWTRSYMPDSNSYSVFAYFSPLFFQHLVSPQYQIELNRRLEAIAHLEVAELAAQIAVSEGVQSDNLDLLKRNGMLPTWFDQRPDNAKTVRSENRWVDSMRGARGSFLPISDVPVDSVTASEAENYARISRFYEEEWRQMDPMVFGLRRFAADDGSVRERVTVEAYISPFQEEKYGWVTKLLATPNALEMKQPEDDVASLQLQMRGNGFLAQVDDYMLFAGVKDMLPPDFSDDGKLLQTLLALRSTPAYLGSWPKPDLVEKLPLGIGMALATPDAAGWSRMLGGLHRWQDSSFSLLSFNRSILESTIPALEVVDAPDSAQARLKVKTLQGTEIGTWLNSLWYKRGWKSSQGNAQLLDVMHQQLKIPAEQCKDVTQRLLDVKLQCPLGGQIEFVAVPSGQGGWWQSTAWSQAAVSASGKAQAPPDYEAPWIDWYRGGRAHLTQGSNSLAVVAEIDLEMKPLPINVQDAIPLPALDFDVFSLPSKLFGGQEEKQPKPNRKNF
ncbi:MAG: hypothetical protein AAF483_12035 [Planctomycetota bacterium]